MIVGFLIVYRFVGRSAYSIAVAGLIGTGMVVVLRFLGPIAIVPIFISLLILHPVLRR